MFGYVTDEQFAIFQKHWNMTVEKSVDLNIIPSCHQLASTEELIPLMYSSTYAEVKNSPKLKKKKIVAGTPFTRYVVLAVKEGHTDLFTRFEQWCSKLNYDNWQKTKPTLSSGMLDASRFDKSLDRTYFNYWMLEFRYKLCNNDQNRQLVMDPPWMFTMWDDMINTITKE